MTWNERSTCHYKRNVGIDLGRPFVCCHAGRYVRNICTVIIVHAGPSEAGAMILSDRTR